ncbi:MAG: TonB-dependent receptor [Caulobacterales bacterium]
MFRRVGVTLLLALAGATAAARAETPTPPVTLSGVDVVGSSPVPGSDLDRDKIPAATQVLSAHDIDRTGIASLTGAFLEDVPSASLNDTQGNVFQPDISFRGFTASPVAGTAQGLAIYLDGARFNDAFGDTVNWDLIAPSAIQSADLEASNPVFGLNALGGSVSIRLKTGFANPGGRLTAYGGSYGRAAGDVEFGGRAGPFALYATADITHDHGFRQTSASDLYRLYADLGWRDQDSELHLGVTAAHDTLGNPGATPVQALNVDISSIFTAPNEVDNRYVGVNVNGTHRLGEATALQALAYFQTLTQHVPNGITERLEPCDGGLLCNDDGTVVTGVGGQPVADFLHGGAYSGLSVQVLSTHTYGASVQVASDAALADHANHVAAGASFDGSDSLFAGSQQIGGFNALTREFVGPGVVQDQPSEGVNPVRVRSITRFYGLFASDVLSLTPNLELTVAGRFNTAQIDLADQLGGPVSGRHNYARFNPSAGLTYRVAPWLQLYTSYSETNRAPTPQELSCASPATPCSLLSFFASDPDLRQVVARTVEAGLRGRMDVGAGHRLSWVVDYYRTENTNDIIFQSTVDNPNLAFFTNAGATLRRGVEANLRFDAPRVHLVVGYAYTDATFRTPLLLNSPSNPAADANGQIEVRPGDRIPGIPQHRANLVLSYDVADRWTLGGSLAAQSSGYRFGDGANLTKPVPGYGVLNLNTSYRLSRRITVFALINNALDQRYDTFGGFGPVADVPWPNVTGGVTDTRTASPGTPIAGYGGLRVSF